MPTDRERMIDDGVDLVREVSAPIGAWEAFGKASTTDGQRRRTLLGVIGATKAKLAAITTELAVKASKGVNILNGWGKEFLRLIGQGHVAGAMAGIGILAPVPADMDTIEANVKGQSTFLSRFRKVIASGAILLAPTPAEVPSNGPHPLVGRRVLTRAEMYGDAIWGGTQGVLRSRAIRDGFDLERRVLAGLENACPQCPPLTHEGHIEIGGVVYHIGDGGWSPIASLPGIGQTICGVRCRCHFEYKHKQSSTVIVPMSATPDPGSLHTPDYQPSKATVTIRPGKEAAVSAARGAVFPDGVEDSTLASLAGARDDAGVILSANGPDTVKLIVRGEGYSARRLLFRDDDGRLIIDNDGFFVDPEYQGKGLGTEVFGRQVEAGIRAGVSVIHTEAARGEDVNGYYTWPRFGYDGPIPPRQRAELPEALKGAANLSDLMTTPEGREWWKAHGDTVELDFDLADGSQSRQAWEAYRAAKKASQ